MCGEKEKWGGWAQTGVDETAECDEGGADEQEAEAADDLGPGWSCDEAVHHRVAAPAPPRERVLLLVVLVQPVDLLARILVALVVRRHAVQKALAL